MGLVNEAAKAVVPGLGAAEFAGNVVGSLWQFGIRHPKSVAVLGAITTFGLFGAPSFADGVRQSYFDVQTTTTIESDSNGYGEITKLNLDLQPQPLTAYTADVTGVKTTLSHDTKATIFGKTITIPSWQGDVSVTSDTTVDATINYDPNQVSIEYDPGKVSDETDDEIIVNIPLAAFSTQVAAEPTTKVPQVSSDIRNLPENLASTYAKDVTQLRSVPGVTTVEGVSDKVTQSLLYTNQIKSLNNVATTCTAELTKNATVYSAIKKNIANDVLTAAHMDNKSELANKTVKEINAMKTVIRIGDETGEKPDITGQLLNTTNPYTDTYNEIKSNKLYQDNTDGTFTCEMSDAVKKLLDDKAAQATSTPTPSATATTSEDKS